MTKLSIYTDGSVKGVKGSWAFLFVDGESVIKESSGSARKVSSNQMELQAAIEALKALPAGTEATLFSDSRILVDTVTKDMAEWKALGWVKRRNKEIRYLDQIKQLDELNLLHKITWKWIPAHRGQIHNERCDQMCIAARS